jgi:hypothetical protein
LVRAEIKETSELKLNGVPAVKIVYTADLAGNAVRNTTYLCVREKMEFVILCAMRDDTQDAMKKQIEDVVNTFKLLENK